jgi:RNA polymerase sigma-54 factor
MHLSTSQSLNLGLSQKLSPRIIQSMAILQMPLAELEERIEQELESNPTLEVVEREGTQTREDDLDRRPLEIDERSGTSDFERLDSYEDANPDAADNEYDASDSRKDAGGALGDDAGDRGVDRSREWDREYEPGAYSASRMAGERDAKMDAMAATPGRGEPLVDQLRAQWSLADVKSELRPCGDLLLGFIEDDGYLRTPLETIADRAVVDARASKEGVAQAESPVFAIRPTVEELERSLKAMQLFLEPAGVCARTAGECLLLQLDALEDEGAELGWPMSSFEHARRIVADHLEDLTQNRLPRVAEKTGFTLTEIKEALTLLKRLSLAPARRLVDDAVRPIVPDAYIEYDEAADKYLVTLNDTHLRKIRINEEYEQLTRGKTLDKQGKEFMRTNLGNARWLIDAVGQRRATLQRVVEKVVEHQRDFFDLGPSALKPLPMTLVAEQLGIHVATVSRAVAEKFVSTPRGVMPLRKFFSGGVQTKAVGGSPAGMAAGMHGAGNGAGVVGRIGPSGIGGTQHGTHSGTGLVNGTHVTSNGVTIMNGVGLLAGAGAGEELAWDAIKEALRDVVQAEDKNKPLSDEAIVVELKRRGIEIARRTVAKYRDQLSIPSARMRKTY